jgi:predicted acylesterase/phospholipase RssA
LLNLILAVASAAVPGILPGVVLMQKTKAGDLRPMNFGSKFKDGSLRVDIPLESLHLLFNVNYAIVSQGMSGDVYMAWVYR